MSDHYRPVSNEGEQIRHRVLAQLDASHLDIPGACISAGCRPSALLGTDELWFVEAVALADLLGCSPAVFFDSVASDTPSDTPGVPDT